MKTVKNFNFPVILLLLSCSNNSNADDTLKVERSNSKNKIMVVTKPKKYLYSKPVHYYSSFGEGKAIVQYSTEFGVTYAVGQSLAYISYFRFGYLAKPEPIPEIRAWHERFQMKYRNGAWFYRIGARVMQLISSGEAPRLVLDSGYNFSQFEISPHGEVLLIGSGVPQIPVKDWAFQDPLEYCEESTLKFIRFYEVGGAVPAKELDFPANFDYIEKNVNHVVGPTGSFWMGDELILYSAEMGCIWQVSLTNKSIKEIDVPWDSLNPNFFREHHPKLFGPNKKDSTIVVPNELFPTSMAFYPTDLDTMQIMLHWESITPVMMEKRTTEMSLLPYFGGLINPNYRIEKTKTYRFNMTDHSIKDNGCDDFFSNYQLLQKGPYLIEFDGFPVRFPIYVAPAVVASTPPGP